ncbi:MAG: hypothetical protein AB7F64_07540 [Gammaproteobacteria bacterium]
MAYNFHRESFASTWFGLHALAASGPLCSMLLLSQNWHSPNIQTESVKQAASLFFNRHRDSVSYDVMPNNSGCGLFKCHKAIPIEEATKVNFKYSNKTGFMPQSS